MRWACLWPCLLYTSKMCIRDSHGTLLYDSNMDILQSVLHVDQVKLQSHAVSSVKSRVTNIKTEMGWEKDIREFGKQLLEAVGTCGTYILTADDRKRVSQIQAEKYESWEWNVGAEPAFSIKTEKRYRGGLLSVLYKVTDQKLSLIHICNGGACLKDETVAMIAGKHSVSSARVIGRWLVQRGIIPVMKSQNASRIRENSRIFDFQLRCV